MVTTTVSEGADEMGGSFSLSFGGEATEMLVYTADETSVEAVLEVSEAIIYSSESGSRARNPWDEKKTVHIL